MTEADYKLHGKSAVSASGHDADGKSTLADENGTRFAPPIGGGQVRRMTVSGTNNGERRGKQTRSKRPIFRGWRSVSDNPR